mgnify:FL=1
MKEENDVVSWRAEERAHTHKDPDWFWGVGIVAISIAVISILKGNPLFGVLIILGAVTLFMHAIKKPEIIEARADDTGLAINDTFFPYEDLHSFYINMGKEPPHIILKSKKTLTPRIVLPFDGTKENDARRVLISHIVEEKMNVPISHQILEFLEL